MALNYKIVIFINAVLDKCRYGLCTCFPLGYIGTRNLDK